MYILSCPECQSDLPVTPAQAGDTLTCSQCQAEVAVPKLGDLKKLPQQQLAEEASRTGSSGGSPVANVAFIFLSLIAVACLIGGGYCAIRWALIQPENDHQSHMAQVEAEYPQEDPANLIRHYEMMEEFSIDLVTPYPYQKMAMEKASWGTNAVISGLLGIGCGLTGIVVASMGRRK